MKKFNIAALLLFSSLFLFAQQTLEKEIQTDTIPFTFTEYNNISIQATLNQRDTLNLMFHTAASDVSITTAALKKINEINLDQSEMAKSWGGEREARYSQNNTLAINSFSWDSLVVWESKQSGHYTDGKFGPNLFKDKIIEVNYDLNILVIHSSLPDLDAGFKKSILNIDRGMMFLTSDFKIDEKEYSNTFLIHSGYSGNLLFDDQFSGEHKLGEKLKTISESQLSDSGGNILKTKKSILPFLSINETPFSEVPVSFFEGAIGRQKMSVIGGGLLKRFNIFFDVENAAIYLKPNTLKNVPFEDA